jgi:hypothetical protein
LTAPSVIDNTISCKNHQVDCRAPDSHFSQLLPVGSAENCTQSSIQISIYKNIKPQLHDTGFTFYNIKICRSGGSNVCPQNFPLYQFLFYYADIIAILSVTIFLKSLHSMPWSGAKLTPFNSGGVCQNCPAKTDDALQQIFISGHYFSQNVGNWGLELKNFRTLKKRVEKFFRT